MGRRGWLRPALEAFTHSHRPAGSNFMLSYTKQLIRGRRKLGNGYQRCTRGMTTSPASVRINDGGVTVTSGIRIGFGGGPMREFRMDSTGSPVGFDALSSSHYARHGLSRRALIGGATAAAGVTLGSGLLSPAVGLAGSHSHPAPRPTTGVTTIEKVDFHFTIFGPGVDPSSITDFKGLAGAAQVQGTGTARKPNGSVET